MAESFVPKDEATSLGRREWIKAAAWIGGVLLVVIVAVLLVYNLAMCGCETRPATVWLLA